MDKQGAEATDIQIVNKLLEAAGIEFTDAEVLVDGAPISSDEFIRLCQVSAFVRDTAMKTHMHLTSLVARSTAT